MAATGRSEGGATPSAAGEFLLTRAFDAPRARVFDAWTKAEHLQRWWGPKGFTVRTCTVDLRPGGVFHYGMRAPNGQDMWGKFTFREIAPPERLVFVVSFSDAEGGVTRHPTSATWPLEVLTTLTFEEKGGRTTLSMRGAPLGASDEERKTFEAGRESLRDGWNGTFDGLAEHLSKADTGSEAEREIVIRRVLDAPPALVYQAWTDPERMSKWWGPRGFTTTVHSSDVRQGGVTRYTMHGPDGTDYANRSDYLEVEKGRRLVYWHGGDGHDPSPPFHVTVTFEDRGGKTALTLRSLFASKAERDEKIRFGAVQGGNQSMDRLAEHLS